MDRNFAKSLKLVLRYEGGYVNHPDDPGGPTNKGITLTTFRRYVKRDAQIADLKAITDAQVAAVYRKQYWDAVKGDSLPDGVDFATFDFGVNSGPSRALKYLAKTQRSTPAETINALCDARLAFMKRINGGKLWRTFGRGWAARVASVRSEGLRMAASARPAPMATIRPVEPKPAPAPTPASDKEMIKRVQTALTLLNYNPGGVDGLIGPLTAGAIRVFRSDNKLPEGDFIDDELISALANAKPREMVPARANATPAQVTSAVPEAKHNWRSKIGAGALAVTGAGGTFFNGVLENLSSAGGYISEITGYFSEVPGWVWFLALLVVAGFVYWQSQQSENASVAAFKTGDRR